MKDSTMRAGVLGTGSHLPERVLDNRELSQRFGCSEEWILSRTGIRERRFADPGTGSSDLGIVAARRALDAANISSREVDLIVCATYTPDMAFPSNACIIQDAIGAKPAAAFDLQAACSGFVYALVTAAQYVLAGSLRYALVVASEINSTIVDPKDQKVTPLFGDGAGAVVVGRVTDGSGLLGFHLGADGGGKNLFFMPAGGSKRPSTFETVEAREHYIKMDGPSLFRFGVDAIVQSSRNALDRAGMSIEDIDVFVPHQANLRIIDAGLERLGFPKERTLVTLDRLANTAAASIPIALDEAVRSRRVTPGMNVLVTGFGAGLTWGSTVLRWS